MQIPELIEADAARMSALRAVSALRLPDCWLAAGFIRNMVWDALHDIGPLPLNDIDVIFFDPNDLDGHRANIAQDHLKSALPDQNWEVRNQATMHVRNGDVPYTDSADAMSYWPELETAVGAQINAQGRISILAPFGAESLLAGKLTPNPRKPYELFQSRVQSKGWLAKYPKLQIVT